MPMIAPQRKPDRQTLTVKLDARLLALLKAYAECIASSQEYVVNEALLAMFAVDKDFRAWLDQVRRPDAQALRAVLAERPAAMVPGRGLRSRAPAPATPTPTPTDPADSDPDVARSR